MAVDADRPMIERAIFLALFHVEHGKSDEKRRKTMKMLKQFIERAECVCQVRSDGEPLGSGFLLFDKYVLTCAHVIYDADSQQLRQPLTVSFGFEDLDVPANSMPVKPEVVVFEKLTDESGCHRDFALLELYSAPRHSGLLKYVAPPPHQGEIRP